VKCKKNCENNIGGHRKINCSNFGMKTENVENKKI
jgi:hypothetical protein